MFPSLIHHDPLCLSRFDQKVIQNEQPWHQAFGFDDLLFARESLLTPHILQAFARKNVQIYLDHYLFQKYPRYLLPKELSLSLFEGNDWKITPLPGKELFLFLSSHRSIPYGAVEKLKKEGCIIIYDGSYHTGLIGEMGLGHLNDHPLADLIIGAYGGGQNPPIGWVTGSRPLMRFLHCHCPLLFSQEHLREEEKKRLALFFWLIPSMHHEKTLLIERQKRWISVLREKGVATQDAGYHRFSIRLTHRKALEFQRRLCKEDISFCTHKMNTSLEEHWFFEGALSLHHTDEHLEQLQELASSL